MSVKVINGQAIPNMPWQDKPADCNEVIWRDRNGDVQKITAATDVPMYHKVAIKEMPKGTEVVKYGEHIGLAACDIHVGEHVHVHNVQNHRENL